MHKNYLLLLAAIACFFASCRKDSQPSAQSDGVFFASPAPQFLYDVSGTMNTVPGTILLAPVDRNNTTGNGMHYLMMTNERGEVLYHKELTGSAWDFRKWKYGGKTRYSYIYDDPTAFNLPGMGNGSVIILDELLTEMKRFNLVAHNDIIPGSDKPNLDVHDFILLSDDHYISMAYYPKEVHNIPANLNPAGKVTVYANIIQEVRNGSVVWQWDATDYPELYEASLQGNNYGDSTRILDYLHMNSMIVDPRDNNIICCFRNTGQVLKIDRTTGDILWRLGGWNSDFPVTPEQQFHWAHNATLVDNNQTLLLFDNSDPLIRPYSRVLEFNLDEASKTLTGFKAFNIPAPMTGFTGSVQKVGSNYLVGGGSANYIMEINPQTGEKILEMKSLLNHLTYRAYKYVD